MSGSATCAAAFNKIACTVVWNDADHRHSATNVVTLADLDLRPIDMLYLLKPEDAQGMTELDDRISAVSHRSMESAARCQSGRSTICRQAARTSACSRRRHCCVSCAPCSRSRGRCAPATCAAPTMSASRTTSVRCSPTPARIAAPLADLKTLANDINAFLATLSPLLADTSGATAPRSSPPLTDVPGCSGLAARACLALRDAIIGLGIRVRLAAHCRLSICLGQVSQLVKRWTSELTDFSDALSAYDALPAGTSDADRYCRIAAGRIARQLSVGPVARNSGAVADSLSTAKASHSRTGVTISQAVLASPLDVVRRTVQCGAASIGTAEFGFAAV